MPEHVPTFADHLQMVTTERNKQVLAVAKPETVIDRRNSLTVFRCARDEITGWADHTVGVKLEERDV
jgi:hypothetical protein